MGALSCRILSLGGIRKLAEPPAEIMTGMIRVIPHTQEGIPTVLRRNTHLKPHKVLSGMDLETWPHRQVMPFHTSKMSSIHIYKYLKVWYLYWSCRFFTCHEVKRNGSSSESQSHLLLLWWKTMWPIIQWRQAMTWVPCNSCLTESWLLTRLDSLLTGDLIEVLTRTDTQEDWWEGQLVSSGRAGGRIGIFPAMSSSRSHELVSALFWMEAAPVSWITFHQEDCFPNY